MPKSTKPANPADVYAGQRVRMFRMAKGLSQEKLAGALGITFQQVQKYEKGTNRIGAGRLRDIALFLDVSITSFFEVGPVPKDNNTLVQLAATSDGIRILRALGRIPGSNRPAVVGLVESIADLLDETCYGGKAHK